VLFVFAFGQSHIFKAVSACLCIDFLEMNLMVKCDVPKDELETDQALSGSFNINDIIGQISNFVGNIREFSSGNEPMGVNVEGFNVAISKDKGEYEFALRLNLVIKPKTIVVVPGTSF
jgi:hypothetical protein